MALRLRRGTDAERGTITPLSGELIYTTDTNKVYVGDGTTVGGNLVGPPAVSSFDLVNDTTPQLGGNLDLNGSDITGTGNINITGTITATGSINLGDGAEDNIIVGGVITSSLTPGTSDAYDLGSAVNRWRQLHVNGISVDGEVNALSFNGNLVADDSTVVFDSFSNSLRAESLSGTFTGNVVGNVVGDVRGSIFSDDSSVIIDSINKVIHANLLLSPTQITVESSSTNFVRNNDEVAVRIVRNSDTDISSNSIIYGQILIGKNDVNGQVINSSITGLRHELIFVNDSTGLFVEEEKFVTLSDGKLAIGGFDPLAALDVRGNAIIQGDIEAAAFKGSVMADDSTTIVDAINGTITAVGFIQFGSYSDAELSSFTPANGMVYYNTTDNRFRGFQNGGWINLDDGTAA